jgi:hypothetical protein
LGYFILPCSFELLPGELLLLALVATAGLLRWDGGELHDGGLALLLLLLLVLVFVAVLGILALALTLTGLFGALLAILLQLDNNWLGHAVDVFVGRWLLHVFRFHFELAVFLLVRIG